MRGVRKYRVGKLLPGKGPEWMGTATMSKTSAFQVSGCSFILSQEGLSSRIDYMLCKYKYGISVCRLKINHSWSASSSCV